MKRLDGSHQVRKEHLQGPRLESPGRPELATNCRDAMTCGFGAMRVGAMLNRLRLHLTTDRFLAERRGDVAWEAACDYSAMVLAYMATQLSPEGLAEPLSRRMPEAPPPTAESVTRKRERLGSAASSASLTARGCGPRSASSRVTVLHSARRASQGGWR